MIKPTTSFKFLCLVFSLFVSNIVLVLSADGQVPVSGIKTIPGDYASIQAAINSLNANGVGAGGVTITIDQGYGEIAPAGGFRLTATGTETSPIVFQTNGIGVHSYIVAPVGTVSVSSSSSALDGVWAFVGSDYVTIDGIDLVDNNTITMVSGSDMPELMEYGYGFFKRTSTNGCQNNTIKNCVIKLSNLNGIGGGSAPLMGSNNFNGSTGILFTTVMDTAVGAVIATTSPSGSNSNNTVSANTFENCYTAIGMYAYGTTNSTLGDNNNTIGGNSLSDGNIVNSFGTGISNYFAASKTFATGDIFTTSTGLVFRVIAGGTSGSTVPATATTTTGTCTIAYLYTAVAANAVLVNNQYNLTVQNNTISNARGTGAAPSVTGLRAIFAGGAASAGGSMMIADNTIALQSVSSGDIDGIYTNAGGAVSQDTISITNNTISLYQDSVPDSLTGLFRQPSGINLYGIRNASNGSATVLIVTGNTFVDDTSYASSGSFRFIYNAAVIKTVNISNNSIGNVYFPGAVGYSGTLYGICNGAGAGNTSVTVQNNTFSNYNFTATATGEHNFIYNGGTCSTALIKNNTWDSLIMKSSGVIHLIRNVAAVQVSMTVDSNRIETLFTRTAACNTFAGYYGDGTTNAATSTFTFSNNDFSNITGNIAGPNSTSFYGIYSKEITGSTTYPRKVFDGNSFTQITYHSSNFSDIIYAAALGHNGANGSVISNNVFRKIVLTGAANVNAINLLPNTFSATIPLNIYGNTIDSLVSNSVGAAVTGCNCNSGTPGLRFYQNKIGNLQANGTSAYVIAQGVYLTSNAPYSVFNNVISDLRTPNSNNPISSVCGINVLGTGSTVNIYHNTIRLSASSSGANFGTCGIYASTEPVVTLNNNIIINTSSYNGTGYTVAYQRASPSLTTYSTSSNNNIFYVGATPSWRNTLFYDGTNSDSTLIALKNRIAPRESVSSEENTVFISTSVSSANFLQPDSTVATALESSGSVISGITTDINGTIRAGNPGYAGTGTAPDIGAYEGENIFVDLNGPVITMALLPNVVQPGDQTFSVTIADASGVNTPVVYYRRNGSDTYLYATGVLESGTAQNGIWSFTISGGLLGALDMGDSIYYYIVAEDLSANANLSSFPEGAQGTVAVSIPPPTQSGYRILMLISGELTVGTNGYYPNLTGPDGAFADINGSSLLYDVKLVITSDLEEPGTVALNQFSDYSVSIVPDDSEVRTITGSTTAALITLNGADRVTIDGSFAGDGKYLRFRNRSTGGATIRFQNDAHRDTIRNCYIEGVSGSVVHFSTAGDGGTGNDSNAVMYCELSDTLDSPTSASLPSMMIVSDAVSNSENYIGYNRLYNFSGRGVSIAGSLAGNDNWVIDSNSFYQGAHGLAKVGSVSTATQPIYVYSGNGHTIKNNNIGGSAPDRSGNAFKALWTASGNVFLAIDLSVGTGSVTTVYGNKISNISSFAATTTTSAFTGVNIRGGLVDVLNNTIGGGANVYDTISDASNSNGGGIAISSLTTAGSVINILGNTIGNITNYCTTGASNRTLGISVLAPAGIVVNVTNNIIHDIKSPYAVAVSASGSTPGGIFVGTTTGITIEGNTVYNIINTSTSTTAASVACGIAFGNAATGGIVKRNRIYNIYGTSSGTGTFSPVCYGIYLLTRGHTVINNQISIGALATGESRVFGIGDASTTAAGTNSYYYNSIYIGGQTQSGSNNSYAFQRMGTAATSLALLRNNILFNNRTSLGTGRNYAYGSNASAGYSPYYLMNNLMVVGDTAKLVELVTGTALGVNTFKNSYTAVHNKNWMESTNNLSAANLFTNTGSGDLSIDATNAASWYVNGKGLALAGVSGDYTNASTPRSMSVSGGATDIGAVEFTTTTTPPLAVASALPAVGTTTTYSFANRAVASITWGSSGTVPGAVTATYYSGESHPAIIAGRLRYNGYVSVDAVGGSGYSFDISMIADSAIWGNITGNAGARLAHYENAQWSMVSTSSSNITTGLLSSASSLALNTLPADFTGADVSNPLPLPVSLVKFTANVSNKDVVLNWNTSSESNNVGFAIERSVDGINFTEVLFEKGNGTTLKPHRYAAIDYAAFEKEQVSTLYYRLKQVDGDGQFNYSNTVMVYSQQQQMADVKVSPNPFTSTVDLEIISIGDKKCSIVMSDVSGKVLLSKDINLYSGINTIQISEFSQLHSGIYFATILMGNETKVIKLIKAE